MNKRPLATEATVSEVLAASDTDKDSGDEQQFLPDRLRSGMVLVSRRGTRFTLCHSGRDEYGEPTFRLDFPETPAVAGSPALSYHLPHVLSARRWSRDDLQAVGARLAAEEGMTVSADDSAAIERAVSQTLLAEWEFTRPDPEVKVLFPDEDEAAEAVGEPLLKIWLTGERSRGTVLLALRDVPRVVQKVLRAVRSAQVRPTAKSRLATA